MRGKAALRDLRLKTKKIKLKMTNNLYSYLNNGKSGPDSSGILFLLFAKKDIADSRNLPPKTFLIFNS